MAAAVDTFGGTLGAPRHGYQNAAAVVPSDSADLADVTQALYVGGAGAVALTMQGGQAVTFSGLPAGAVLEVRASRVKATGTTATNLIALW